jgi:RHS repeat-associated protein
MRYTAWGEVRYNWGSTPTDYTYTGQYSNVPEFGLYYYNARWYDPQLGRFAQADTIIPEQSQGVQAWDRYAYTNNNPLRYTDPTGHYINIDIPTLLSIIAMVCDIVSYGASGAGVLLEGVAALGGEAITPVPAVDGAVGFSAAVAFYNQTFNQVENIASATSFSLVATAEYLTDQHDITEGVDPLSGAVSDELVFGPDTSFSAASLLIGNTPLTPDAITDSIANLAVLRYDAKRLMGQEPEWGLYRFSVGHIREREWFDKYSYYWKFERVKEEPQIIE